MSGGAAAVIRHGLAWVKRGRSRARQALSWSRDLLRSRATPLYRGDLAIIDDAFPSRRSSFRYAEFLAYLRAFPRARVYATGAALPALGESRTIESLVREEAGADPGAFRRVTPVGPRFRLRGRMVYVVFLNNAYQLLASLERAEMPFMFTLYPGGGFRLDDPLSDRKLDRLLSSRCFRGVVVTQSVTRDYVLARGKCDPGRVHFVFGLVLPFSVSGASPPERRPPEEEARARRICFAAYKYMPRGSDKGFDTFAAAATRLAALRADVTFHVVGTFTESDLEPSAPRDRFTFHGVLESQELTDLYAGMDLIVSPNVPFLLAPGAFDGFPTGACVEAGLCGVAVLCTDTLNQNRAFVDGRDITIISPSAERIVEVVSRLLSETGRVAELGAAARRAFRSVYSGASQLSPRLDLIAGEMAGLPLRTCEVRE